MSKAFDWAILRPLLDADLYVDPDKLEAVTRNGNASLAALGLLQADILRLRGRPGSDKAAKPGLEPARLAALEERRKHLLQAGFRHA
ncbi:MAG: hypothetical protein EOO40_01265 [Deltaproteobacteria bacterium]|nr:MAG: hypothetical protein EOO40_01265 [Deltaproteobacteria bacterium]